MCELPLFNSDQEAPFEKPSLNEEQPINCEKKQFDDEQETKQEEVLKSQLQSAFQLSDIVWARTDSDGKLFWPAKISEEGEPGSNVWQNERKLYVRFFWPPSNKATGAKIESRWVISETDIVPFEKSKDFVLFYEERIGRAYIKAAVRLQKKCPVGQKW